MVTWWENGPRVTHPKTGKKWKCLFESEEKLCCNLPFYLTLTLRFLCPSSSLALPSRCCTIVRPPDLLSWSDVDQIFDCLVSSMSCTTVYSARKPLWTVTFHFAEIPLLLWSANADTESVVASACSVAALYIPDSI